MERLRRFVWGLLLAALVLVPVGWVTVIRTRSLAQDRPVQNRPPAAGSFQARVVRFGTVEGRWQANRLIVVASTVDGRTGEGMISTTLIDRLDCKVGDPVSAHMAGPVMVVDPLTCNQSLR